MGSVYLLGFLRDRPPIAAFLGLAAPVLFTFSAFAQSLLRTEHNLAEDPISALAAGDSGWIQSVSFALFGVSLAAFVIGLHHGIRSTSWLMFGPAFLLLSAAGLIGTALFPATNSAGEFRDDRILHLASAVAVFTGAGLGLIGFSKRMAQDTMWQGLAKYSFLTGVSVIVLFITAGVLARPSDAPLHHLLGLSQWLLLALWLPTMGALALRLATNDLARRD